MAERSGKVYRMTVLGHDDENKKIKVRIDGAPYESWVGREIVLRYEAIGSNKIAKSIPDEHGVFVYSPSGLVKYIEKNHPNAVDIAKKRAIRSIDEEIESQLGKSVDLEDSDLGLEDPETDNEKTRGMDNNE